MVFSKFVSAESSDPAALALRHTDAASVLQYIAFGVRQWNPSLNMKAYIASPCAMLEFLIQQFDEVPGTLLHRDLVMCLRDIRGPPASSYYHPLDATHTLTHWSVGIVTRLRLMSFPAIPGRLSPQAYRAFICAMTVLLAIHYDPRGPTWVHLAMNNGLIRVLASARNIWPNQCPEISATLLRKVLLPYLFYYRVCVAVNAQLDWLPNLDLDHLIQGLSTTSVGGVEMSTTAANNANQVTGMAMVLINTRSDSIFLPTTRYIKSFVRETILRHWKAIVEPLKKYQPSIPSLRVDLTGLVTTVALTEPSPEATRRLNGEREFRIDIVFPRPGGREPAVLNAVIIYPEPDPKEEYVPWLEEHLESLKMLQGVDFDPMLTR
ncbi:hypothetical protein CCMSSC00406_0008644 [Pleurotus cornucopiae]|uniref:Uncharacterized protein n=1 Tax=Pleurotus cornucopiae TaxID=5321 RepID=A0ACB7JBB0_PLECO|nr:hypothetical protein CCMSSC00406_0008644 [Pleurotus cornucopiae]